MLFGALKTKSCLSVSEFFLFSVEKCRSSQKSAALIFSFVIFSFVLTVGCRDKQSSTDIVVYSDKEYPSLSKHSAFLFVDNEQKLGADKALTVSDLTLALNALNEKDGEFSANTDNSIAVSYEQLKSVLNNMFDSETVSAVFGGSATVKRVDFAIGMCTLLGRGTNEKIEYSQLSLPKDLTFSTEDLAYLLEASIEHTSFAPPAKAYTENPPV